jgi:hypothetical protein
MKRLTVLLLLLSCFACKHKQAASGVHITLINNKQSLQITGISHLILKDIATDSADVWQNLFPVYKMPADTELKNYQPVQAGQYVVKDSLLIYTPDTAFNKQQTYFVRYYRYGDDGSIWNFIKGKKHPGDLLYTDLIFKR